MAQSHKDLIVYQKGYKLVLEIYKATKAFPKEEIYGLVSQMRRSAVSISNARRSFPTLYMG
jgi:four helix bundle protein